MARRGWIAVLACALAFALAATPAFAQGGAQTATLAGVVTDKDGGVIPGATVIVKNVATGESNNGVTNANGAYSFPGLAAGEYKVTISLTGFKTAEISVRLQSGSANSITTKLEVGTISEVVTVTAGTDLVRTQTPTVTSTINSDFIQSLPRSDRTALNFLIFMPGVTTVGGANSARSSTISGLPQNTINITIDGISNSNLLQSGDGFFTLVGTRLDAVEEVAMTTATAGADATGQGAVQIRFQTRSGTNKFETSLYSYNQHKAFNSNAFFTRLAGLPKPAATNFTYGGRVGGPILLPGFDGRGKAFFFFNQEEVYAPAQTQRTRTLIRQSALEGNFTYGPVGSQNTVNVLQLAAATGNLATYDPVVKALLTSMRTAAATTGTITEVQTSPNTGSYAWFVDRKTYRHAPTTNITVNLSPKHRVQGSYYWQRFNDTPDTLNSADPSYPGFPHFANQSSFRTSASMSLRSTLSSSMVNEVRGGWQWSPVEFFINEVPSMFSNQGGYNLNLGFGLTNAVWGNFANAPEVRNTWNWTVTDSFNYLKGAHSMTFGGDFTRVINWIDDWTTVQDVTLGFNQTFDPAEASGMFSTTNFPGASSGDRNNARALYALLTGRISSLPGQLALNEAGTEYIYNGHVIQREREDEYSFFAQDQWRWKPTLTITAGLRYELQYPIVPTNGVFTSTGIADVCGPSGSGTGVGGRFCNIFKPGTITNPSVVPQFVRYSPNAKGYDVDYNNWAPNVGASWRPNVQAGFLRSILGDPEVATISSGFSRSYIKERVDRFLTVFGSNPGATLTATRNTATGGFPLVPAGESWPILFRETSRLGAPAFNPTPSLPILATTGSNARIFDPNIEVPYADSWQVGLQRAVSRDSAIEVRYIGNKAHGPWVSENWNQVNIFENGFLEEFKLAEANLHANVVAGRGATMAYFGPGTGTAPLPIILAHFNGISASGASNAANYTGANWTNTTFVGRLDPFFPDPRGLANDLRSNSSGALFNAAKGVGIATNFWQMNPLVNQAAVTRNLGGSNTHSMIVDYRRRLSQGLAAQVSYTYQRNWSYLTSGNFSTNSNSPSAVYDAHFDLINLESSTVPHAFKMLWTYDIPFGRGKRFGSNINPWLDYVAGGWTFSGTGRVQQQNFILRGVELVGMTLDEAKAALKPVRFVTDPITGAVTVWNFPQDIIDNTRKAFNTDETQANYYAAGTEPTGRYFRPAGGPTCVFLQPGDCGNQDLKFNGRWFGEFDFAINKAVPLPGKARFDVRVEVFNALMAKNFPNQLNPSNSANVFRITTTQSAARTAQLVFRVSW